MAGPNYKELGNLIREKCRIKITKRNNGKFVFSKEEQLIILTYMTSLEDSLRRRGETVDLVRDAVKETLTQLGAPEPEGESGVADGQGR